MIFIEQQNLILLFDTVNEGNHGQGDTEGNANGES